LNIGNTLDIMNNVETYFRIKFGTLIDREKYYVFKGSLYFVTPHGMDLTSELKNKLNLNLLCPITKRNLLTKLTKATHLNETDKKLLYYLGEDDSIELSKCSVWKLSRFLKFQNKITDNPIYTTYYTNKYLSNIINTHNKVLLAHALMPLTINEFLDIDDDVLNKSIGPYYQPIHHRKLETLYFQITSFIEKWRIEDINLVSCRAFSKHLDNLTDYIKTMFPYTTINKDIIRADQVMAIILNYLSNYFIESK